MLIRGTLIALVILAIAPLVDPRIDLAASAIFYQAPDGFILENNAIALALRDGAYWGARLIGLGLLLAGLCCLVLRQRGYATPAKKLWFLFFLLIIGPGLIVNAGFKDQWGRARPREIVEFGGTKAFSAALSPQENARRNGSFVSGDAAFGFSFTGLGVIAPTLWRRRLFGGGLVIGLIFATNRLMMGAHFLSDIMIAALLILGIATALGLAMFGRAHMKDCWQTWWGRQPLSHKAL